jgi:hypothetical protein
MRTSHQQTHTRSKQFWRRLLVLTLLVGGLGWSLTRAFGRSAQANELEAVLNSLEQARAQFRANPTNDNASVVEAALAKYKVALSAHPATPTQAKLAQGVSFNSTKAAGVGESNFNVMVGPGPDPSAQKRGKGKERNELPLRLYGPNGPNRPDGAISQPAPGQNTAGAPILNFDMISADEAALAGGRFAPPDTVADVGSNNQIVEAVNISWAVYRKDTGARIGAVQSFDSLFAPVGGTGAAWSDPIVLFDPLADRWFILMWDTARDAGNRGNFFIAVSKTVDATGGYWLYRFPLFPAADADYPHVGVWTDGYYMTTNNFFDSGAFAAGVTVFERAKMLVGDTTALALSANISGSGGMLPTDIDGLNLPPAGASELIMEFRADEDGGGEIDGLRAFRFVPDFVTPANSILAQVNLGGPNGDLPVAAFDPRSPISTTNTRGEVDQAMGEDLQSLSGRLMHRLAYRNIGGTTQSYVLNWTVNVSGVNPVSVATYQAGVRWTELRRDIATGLLTVNQQGTLAHNPGTGAGGRENFMASIAQDAEGNIGLGYSAASQNDNLKATIGYTGRLTGDPLDTLPGAEQIALTQAQVGAQTGTGNRWGDYSSMSVDPADECTFWHANEYYSLSATSFDWATRMVSFKVNASCVTPGKGTIVGVATNSTNGNAPLADVKVDAANNAYIRSTDAAGNYSMMVAPGTYAIRCSKNTFSTVTGSVTVAAGQTATFNCALQGVPLIAQVPPTESSVTAESCATDGRLDPNETVTVNLCVVNNGGAPTTNLIGIVANTGGVTNVSGPQSYGAVAVGATVCRTFTFRVNPALACGANVVVSLSLQDGATNFGTFAYTFGSGTPVLVLNESFNGVMAPALPAGWTATNAIGAAPLWQTQAAVGVSASNAAVVDDPPTVADKQLTTPAINLTVPNATLSFQHTFNLESGFDGGVVEASINNGPWNDVTSATVGGTFTQNGYTGALSTNPAYMNPLVGRQAFTGTNTGGFGTYITSTVQFGAALNGQSVRFRFRMGSDTSVAGTGWRVDNVQVANGNICCTTVTPVVSLTDPLGCLGPGGVVTGSVSAANPSNVAITGSVMVALPVGLVGVPNSCTANPAVTTTACTVGTTSVVWEGTIPAGATLTFSYRAEVGQVAAGTQLCVITTGNFPGTGFNTIQACTTVNCQPLGPGVLPNTGSPVSDQRAGSVLIYNLYTSTVGSSTQNTSISLTNIEPNRTAFVHLFFVDGASCSVADAYLCLTPNQTASFLASDLDPGTTGYLVAVATDRNGCPINFNYLIGDEFVKLTSGHQANLAAEAIQAVAGGLTACTPGSVTATLAFNGVSYGVLPRVLAVDNVGSRADGNDTLVIVNSVGGDLRAFAQTLRPLFGIIYDDAEQGLSFTFAPGTCQFRGTVNSNFPKTTPRFESWLPAGRSAWFKFWVSNTTAAAQEPILGAVLNRNSNAGSNSGAFNGGHNLHKLNTTPHGTLTIPVFPVTCQ